MRYLDVSAAYIPQIKKQVHDGDGQGTEGMGYIHDEFVTCGKQLIK